MSTILCTLSTVRCECVYIYKIVYVYVIGLLILLLDIGEHIGSVVN